MQWLEDCLYQLDWGSFVATSLGVDLQISVLTFTTQVLHDILLWMMI